MADQKISALPDAITVVDADVVPIVTAGLINKKAAFSVIGNYIRSLFATTALGVDSGGTGSTTAGAARTALGAAASGANADITSLTGLTTAIPIAEGGTGSTTVGAARTALGAAASGANGDITSLTGLTTAIPVAEGGTGSTTAGAARTALGLAIGANVQAFNANLTTYAGIAPSANVQTLLGAATFAAFRTSLGVAIGTDVQAFNANLTTYAGIAPSADVQTLLGAATFAAFRTSLGAAASGANGDITSLTGLTTAIPIAGGGTGATTAGAARTALGAAASGANGDITSLTGLTTAIPVSEGGTGSMTVAAARTALSITLNNSATTNPGTANDNTQGYTPGSKWLNTVTGNTFACRDTTTNAAVWEKQAAAFSNGYISGNWINPFLSLVPVGGTAAANTAVQLIPFFISERVTISQLGVRISTLSASGNAMLGIYANNPTTGRPTGNPLASITGLSTTSAAPVSGALGSNVTLEPGLYWAAGEMDNATSAFQSTPAASYMAALIGSATLANVSTTTTSAGLLLSVTNTYGTFPDLTSASFTEGSASRAPMIFFKVA